MKNLQASKCAKYVCMAAVLTARFAAAADFAWTGAEDENWNETAVNWSGAGTVWTNGAANHAAFGGGGPREVAADTVTLGDLRLEADGYTIGGGPLTMHGTPRVDAGMTVTLTAPVTNVGVWAKGGEGTIILNPEGAASNVFYALKAATGTVVVAGGTNLVTQKGSSPEDGPAFWVDGGTLVVGGGLLKTTGNNYARVSGGGHLWITNGVCDLLNNSELLNAFNTPGWTTVEGNGYLAVNLLRIVKNSFGAELSGVNVNTGGTIRLAQFRLETDYPRPATINFNGGHIISPRNEIGDLLGGTEPNWTNIIVNVLAGGVTFDTANLAGFNVRQKLTGTPGDGGVTKVSGGTLCLWGTDSTYTGGTRVRQGTLNLVHDRGLGAVPAAPETNLWFLGSSTLQSSGNHALDANRTLWISNGVQVTIHPQSYTQTVHGAIFCADTNAAVIRSGGGGGWAVLAPGDAVTNVYGTLQCAEGNLEIRSGTHLVTRGNTTQGAPGLRINGGTLLVSGGLLKTTEEMFVNVDGGHLLVTNGIVDATSCREILNGIGSTFGYTTVSDTGLIIARQVRISQNTQHFTNTVVSVNTGGVLRLNSFYIDIGYGGRQQGMLALNGGTVEARENNNNFLGTTTEFIGDNNDKWLTNIVAEVREGGAIFDTAGYTISVKQPLYSGAEADGGLIKRGEGTLTLLNTNTYNGVTIAAGGVLRFGRDNLLPETNMAGATGDGVLDANGKTQTLVGLIGSGTVTNLSALTVTDVITPGTADAPGTLTLAGLPTLGAGCALAVDVTAAGASDCLHVQGDLDLSALTLRVNDVAQLDRVYRYTIVTTSGTLTSSFASRGNLPSPWAAKVAADRKSAYLVYDFGTMLQLR